MKRIANRDARKYVQNREEFIGSNTRGSNATEVVVTHEKERWFEDGRYYINILYIVWTYNTPLFVYDEGVERWFENTTKYSVTSSKHRKQLKPHTETIPMDEIGIGKLISVGSYREFIKRRING